MYLALSAKKLQCLTHHPLWGLQFNGSNARTLYDDALHLHAYPVLREQMIDNVAPILQRAGWFGWWARGFCWLFNWNQYRANYYALQAYFSWQIYEQGITMINQNEQSVIEETGGFLTTGTNLTNRLPTSIVWLGKEAWGTGQYVFSLLFGNKPLKTVQFPVSETGFEVNEAMISPLDSLGISASTGQIITFDALKSAYKASRLQAHPDKPSGNHERFILVTTAYEMLTELIRAIGNPNDPFGIWGGLKKYHDEQSETIQQLKADFKDIAEKVDRYVETVNQHVETVKQHSDRVDNMVQRTEHLADEIADLRATMIAIIQQQNNTSASSSSAAQPLPQEENPNGFFSSARSSPSHTETSASEKTPEGIPFRSGIE